MNNIRCNSKKKSLLILLAYKPLLLPLLLLLLTTTYWTTQQDDFCPGVQPTASVSTISSGLNPPNSFPDASIITSLKQYVVDGSKSSTETLILSVTPADIVEDTCISLSCASDHGWGYSFHDNLYADAFTFTSGKNSTIMTVYDVMKKEKERKILLLSRPTAHRHTLQYMFPWQGYYYQMLLSEVATSQLTN